MAVAILGSLIAEHSNSPAHAIESGSNRLFVFGVTRESSGSSVVTAASMGGRSLTELPNASIEYTNGTTYNSASLWYAKEGEIALMSDGNISLTWSGSTANPAGCHHAFFSDVDQTTPFEDSDEASSTGTTVVAIAAALVTVSNGYLFALCGAAQDNTWTWTSPLVELSDISQGGSANFSSSAAGVSTSGSSVTVEATSSLSNPRNVLVAASLRPAASGAAFANPLGLLGVGRAA